MATSGQLSLDRLCSHPWEQLQTLEVQAVALMGSETRAFVHLSLVFCKLEGTQFKPSNWPSYWSSHWPRSKRRCPNPTLYLGEGVGNAEHFKNYPKEQYTDAELYNCLSETCILLLTKCQPNKVN